MYVHIHHVHDIMSIIMTYMSHVHTGICMVIVCMFIRVCMCMVYLRIYKCGYVYISRYKYIKSLIYYIRS